MSKNVKNKKIILFYEKKNREIWTIFDVKKLTLKAKVLQFLMMFTKDSFFIDWLLILSLWFCRMCESVHQKCSHTTDTIPMIDQRDTF